jgi:hypothetical protein
VSPALNDAPSSASTVIVPVTVISSAELIPGTASTLKPESQATTAGITNVPA